MCIHQYIYICTYRVRLCLVVGQGAQLEVWRASATHMLCLCCRASCGPASHTLCRPDLLDPPTPPLPLTPHKNTYLAFDLIFWASTYRLFSQMCREDGGALQSVNSNRMTMIRNWNYSHCTGPGNASKAQRLRARFTAASTNASSSFTTCSWNAAESGKLLGNHACRIWTKDNKEQTLKNTGVTQNMRITVGSNL